MEKNASMKMAPKALSLCGIKSFILIFFPLFFSLDAQEIVPRHQYISDEQARFELATLLSYREETLEEVLAEFRSLLCDFPYSSPLLFALARIYAWQKNYEASFFFYDLLSRLRPFDPTPKREKARAAYWGYFPKTASALYEELLKEYPPHRDFYKIIRLEFTAKKLDWHLRPRAALPFYRELIELEPQNEEALYGYAQDLSSVGLCEPARAVYRRLLEIDPHHPLAKRSLQRHLQQDHLLLQSSYSYWKERGRGPFSQSQIARHRCDEVVEWPVHCQLKVRFIQTLFLEFPFLNHNKYYPAEGQTLEVDSSFNPYFKAHASISYKNYFHQFASKEGGLLSLWFTGCDFLQVGAGIEKRDEIYNLFSLKEGIQAKIAWGALTSHITHEWSMGALYRHLDYNDSNHMNHVEVYTSYSFSDDPDIFKVILQGSYRNTARLSRIITDKKGRIVDVIHPYWTPQDYYANSITLEYRHSFAFFNYCEAPLHYLDLQLTLEEDSTRNPSLQLLFEWRRDWMSHLSFSLKGMIHQSKEWNAEGIWSCLSYRF